MLASPTAHHLIGSTLWTTAHHLIGRTLRTTTHHLIGGTLWTTAYHGILSCLPCRTSLLRCAHRALLRLHDRVTLLIEASCVEKSLHFIDGGADTLMTRVDSGALSA